MWAQWLAWTIAAAYDDGQANGHPEAYQYAHERTARALVWYSRDMALHSDMVYLRTSANISALPLDNYPSKR